MKAETGHTQVEHITAAGGVQPADATEYQLPNNSIMQFVTSVQSLLKPHPASPNALLIYSLLKILGKFHLL